MPWEAADGDGEVLNRHTEQVPRHHPRTGSHSDGDLCTCGRQLRSDFSGRIPRADDEDATSRRGHRAAGIRRCGECGRQTARGRESAP